MSKENMVLLSLVTCIYWFCAVAFCMILLTLMVLGFTYLDVFNIQGLICLSIFTLLLVMVLCKLFTRLCRRYIDDETR